jgi:NitT/TauT family transport system substrate-binding protein
MNDETDPGILQTSHVIFSRRSILTAGTTIALVGAPWIRRGYAADATKKHIDVALGFLGMGRHAGYYVALAKGYYADVGLDVALKPSTGNAISFQEMAVGRVQFTNSDIPTMMQIQGKNPGPWMKSVAVFYEKAPMTCFFFEGQGIKTPKDLEGRTIADSPGSTATSLFPIFAKANNIDASKVKWKIASSSAKVGLLLQGQVDAVMLFLIGKPAIMRNLQPQQKLGYFNYGDYGVNIYGDGLIATEKYLRESPDEARAFLRATMHGYTDAFANPAEAAAIMGKTVVELNKDDAVQEIEILKQSAIGPYQKEHGLGFQEPAKIKASYDTVVQDLGQPIARPYTDLFTNDFL